MCEGKVSEAAKVCLGCFVEDVQRVGQLSGTFDLFDWDQFLSSTRGVIRETRGLPGAILLPLCHGIMVPVEAWPEVCQGPADAGACVYLRAEKIFQVGASEWVFWCDTR